jgi:hypothetical protein
MHQIVFGKKAREGYRLDHVDSNGLDNRSNKIREISSGANGANRIKKENTTSKYIGVSAQVIDNSFKGWVAAITFDRSGHHLGIFRNERDAAKIRDIYAVYYYKEAAKLNRDENGDLFLSKDEINDIISNGIPEKYKIAEKKVRALPECIYITGNRYYYGIRYKNIYYYKSFKTLNEAIDALAELKTSFRELEERERQEKEQNITRNADGIAVLYTHDKAKNINGEFWVDDEIWKEFIHYSWYVTDGYASGYVNKFLNSLHNHVYIKYYGAIPKGMSIDHKKSDARYDCRIANLRAATYSQQVQNTDRSKNRKGSIKYAGIRIANGQFFAETRKDGVTFQIGPYRTVEDAASGYNSLVLKHYGPNAKINIVDNKETTFNDLFHKDNLTIQYLKQIKTLGEINAVFYANEDWRESGNILLKEMKKSNLNKYIQIAIELKEMDLA